MSAPARKRLMLERLFFLSVVASTPTAAECDPTRVAPGAKVRFVRSQSGPLEATVLSSRIDLIVVAYDVTTYPPSAPADTVWLSSLQSLEVQRQPMSTAVGLFTGILVGGALGGAVAELASIGQPESEDFFIVRPWMFGAPVGAILGGVFGAAYAHDRGQSWARVPLPGG